MISIVIPVHNEKQRLDRCLAALRGQSVQPELEIVVVDDGSTDGGVDYLERSGVRVVRQVNQGPAAARNTGAASARGDIILFIDADCVADANWLREMLRPFEDSEVVAVKGAYRTRQRGLVARFVQIEFEHRYRRLRNSRRVDFLASYSVGFRRRYFLEIGGFRADLIMNEDVELAYRISHSGGKMVFNRNAAVYHEHPETLRSYFLIKFWRGYWRAVVYKKYPGKAVSDSYTPPSLKFQVLSVYLVSLCGLAGLVIPRGLLAAGLVAGVSTATMARFTLRALRRDFAVALLSVPLLWVRATALMAGTAAALIAVGRARAMNYRRTKRVPADESPRLPGGEMGQTPAPGPATVVPTPAEARVRRGGLGKDA